MRQVALVPRELCPCELDGPGQVCYVPHLSAFSKGDNRISPRAAVRLLTEGVGSSRKSTHGVTRLQIPHAMHCSLKKKKS